MGTDNSNAIRIGVISTVVGGVILALMPDPWSLIKSVLLGIWTFLIATKDRLVAPCEVPTWLLVIMGLLALIPITKFFVGIFNARSEESDLEKYREDFIAGAKWKWRWHGTGFHNLWCFCPSCDAELVYDDRSWRESFPHQGPKTDFICENCSRRVVCSIDGGNKEYAVGFVEREIRRRIRIGQYPKSSNNLNV